MINLKDISLVESDKDRPFYSASFFTDNDKINITVAADGTVCVSYRDKDKAGDEKFKFIRPTDEDFHPTDLY